VFAARRGYRVPYFRADMAIERDQQGVSFRSERVRGPAATFQARYAPAGAAVPADRAEPLETWLTERYCLYTVNAAGQPLRGEIHHPPWPLQRATAEIKRNTMGRHIGVELEGDPLLHYAHRQDVVFWPLLRA
jgi:uncharacterized protein YqjF (DUF2071 family)